MAKELIINASLPEVRIALMEDGQIQELLIERDSDKGIVGNIYKGRVTRVLPGMQAAFVDIGLDKAAFLYVDDIYVHPKVMGEETDVASEDEEEGDTGEGAPIQAFQSGVTDEITGSENAENESPAAESEGSNLADGDTALLESHVSEHFEREEEAFSNEDVAEVEGHHADTDESEAEGEVLEAGAETDSDDLMDESSDESGDEDADGELDSENESEAEGEALEAGAGDDEGAAPAAPLAGLADQNQRPIRKGRRRRGKRGRNRQVFAAGETGKEGAPSGSETIGSDVLPESMGTHLDETGSVESDRSQVSGEDKPIIHTRVRGAKGPRPEFKEPRGRDRRIKSKNSRPRAQANIADLLKEGQEVVVQVAKDPIATKGARLTCHVSLPGRHLVCMPTIDHVGVSRRIERDDERRSLRNFVERNRPQKMGFIVRTASGGKDPESWIKQDIDYLSKLWKEIRTKTDDVSAPSLVYEDLNSVLRAIRDWVNEDIDRIIVDSRYYYNELMAFSERFMPQLAEIIELYQGDIPIFDAYGISGELHRSLERKVWLKSGGYLVIDQAEALVAIDVNTGRFVGKKSLEDTILKTNMEAAEEIAYQLRLRNCGGIIICDFIDMERDENRMRVYRALDEALKKDRARPTIQKISDLGLVEMTRKRTRDTVIRTLCEPCSNCEGKGYTKSKRTVAYDILREIERLSVDREAKKVLVSAHESVVDILAIDLRDVLDQLERKYNKTVFLQAVMDYHSEQFEVVTDRMGSKRPTGDIARQLRMERERSERKEKSENRDDSRRDHRKGRNQERNQDRNQERNHDRNNDRNHDRKQHSRDRNQERSGGGEFKSPGVIQPVIQPVTPPVAQDLETAVEVTTQVQAGAPQFSAPQATMKPSPVSKYDETGIEDEDQLAYLRAQAAQDAALASLSSGGAVNPPNQNRNRPEGRNNNQNAGRGGRHDRNRGGRHDRNRNDPNRGGQRGFRPGGNTGGGGGVIQPRQPMAAQSNPPAAAQTYSEPAEAPTVPDYEVLSKPEGDGSNS